MMVDEDQFPLDPTNGVLPPQTAMPYRSPAAQEQLSGDKPLPVVARGQLAEWIQNHQNEEKKSIPSGVPSQEDQQRANISRGIGNATSNLLAGVQNTIGILRPGSANYTQAEMAQKQGEQYANEALGRAPAARREAIENSQLGAIQDEKRQKQMQMVQAIKHQNDINNPESDTSKEAQRAMLARLRTYSAVTRNPALKEQMDSLMMTVPSMSASRLDSLDKQGYVDKLLAQESNERAMGNKNATAMQTAEATNGLGYARLGEERRWHDIEQQQKGESKGKLQMNEDKKAEDEITTLRTAISEMEPLVKNLESGKINNNAIHDKMNEVKKKVGSWIPGLTHPDPELQNLRTNLPLTQGAVEAAVTGSKRYTPQRWAEFTPTPGEGNEVSAQKLKAGTEFLKRVLEEKLGLLHTEPGGTPTSASGLARSLPKNTIPNAMQNIQNKAPIGVQKKLPPVGSIVIQGGRRYEIQPDGSGKEIQ